MNPAKTHVKHQAGILPYKYQLKKTPHFLWRKSQDLKSFNEDGMERQVVRDVKGQDVVLKGEIQSKCQKYWEISWVVDNLVRSW